MIDPAWVSGLAAILFIIGLWGAFSRKNAIVVLMCIELMLNAVNLQFVAAATHWGGGTAAAYGGRQPSHTPAAGGGRHSTKRPAA